MINSGTPPLPEDDLANASLEDIHSALFDQLVGGHAQMALTFLGKIPNPQSGELEEPDLQAAKIFIDQLEMLQAKTRGNLSEPEKAHLARALSAVKSAFAEVLNHAAGL